MKNSKRVKLLLAMTIALTMIFVNGLTSLAKDDVHTLVTTLSSTQSNDEITIKGSKPPGSSASTHDVSVSQYNYQVQKVGYRVYTDKWLKGASSFDVTVANWKKINVGGSDLNQLTIAVLDSKGKLIDSEKIDPTKTGSVTLKGLTSTSKYYVRFEVPTNGNSFSFNGSISES